MNREFNLPTYISKNIDHCIVLGAGASLSTWDEAFPLNGNFFSHPSTTKALNENPEFKLIVDVKNHFFGENIKPEMEQFFTLIDQFYQWFYLKDIENKPLALESAAFFPCLPYTFPSARLEDETQLDKRARLLYDHKHLKEFQKQLSSLFLSEKDTGNTNPSFNVLIAGLNKLRWLFPKFINQIFLNAIEEINNSTSYDGSFQQRCTVFYDYLKKIGKNNINKVSIISFNYDLVADATLYDIVEEFYPNEWNSDVIYMQVFEPYETKDRSAASVLPMLLKPHGSLNWLNYPDYRNQSWQYCHFRHQRPKYPTKEFIEKSGLVPRIFPPWISKVAETTPEGPIAGYVRQWVVSLDVLLNAQNWTIIGYSLPPADYQTTWLLQMALSYRKNNPPKVTIVDKYVDEKNLNVLTFFDRNNIKVEKQPHLKELVKAE